MALPSCFGAAGGSIVKLDKNEIEKSEIEIKDNTTQMNNSLLINTSEDLSKIIDEQKEHDIRDLEILWKATIENNQVVEFALKKLATPESQRRIQVIANRVLLVHVERGIKSNIDDFVQ